MLVTAKSEMIVTSRRIWFLRFMSTRLRLLLYWLPDLDDVRLPVEPEEVFLLRVPCEEAREEAVLLVPEAFFAAGFPEELLRCDVFAVLVFFLAVEDFVAIQFLFSDKAGVESDIKIVVVRNMKIEVITLIDIEPRITSQLIRDPLILNILNIEGNRGVAFFHRFRKRIWYSRCHQSSSLFQL